LAAQGSHLVKVLFQRFPLGRRASRQRVRVRWPLLRRSKLNPVLLHGAFPDISRFVDIAAESSNLPQPRSGRFGCRQQPRQLSGP
jgi:hypothetical protein